jgi:outer membrane protein TolC
LWLPTVSLFAGYLGYGSAGGSFVTEWQGGAQITYPIFTGGSRVKMVARAGSLAEVALQEIRNAEISVRDEVDRGLSAVREAQMRVVAVEEAVDHLAEVARIELLALASGTGTQTEYLRSEAELLSARASLIDARNSEIAARVELARVVGQLSQAWLDRELENTP